MESIEANTPQKPQSIPSRVMQWCTESAEAYLEAKVRRRNLTADALCQLLGTMYEYLTESRLDNPTLTIVQHYAILMVDEASPATRQRFLVQSKVVVTDALYPSNKCRLMLQLVEACLSIGHTIMDTVAVLKTIHRQAGEVESAEEPSGEELKSWWSMLSGVLPTVFPVLKYADLSWDGIVKRVRDINCLTTGIEKIAKMIESLVIWVKSLYKRWFCETPVMLRRWLDAVDKHQMVYDEGYAFSTERIKLAKSLAKRRELFGLVQEGKKLMRMVEDDPTEKVNIDRIRERQRVLDMILKANLASYVGSEGKLKPWTVLFYGKPGQGKTAMMNHFYADVYAVVQPDQPFNPATDRYTINPATPYFDTYSYQKLTDLQDFLQIKNLEERQQQVNYLMSMADESSCPLNAAEVSSKGVLYFQSEHLAVTTNVFPDRFDYHLNGVLEEQAALIRRFDVIVEVKRDEACGRGFLKESMMFVVTGGTLEHKQYTWYEFVEAFTKGWLDDRRRSENLENVTTNTAEIDQIRKRLSGQIEGDEIPFYNQGSFWAFLTAVVTMVMTAKRAVRFMRKLMMKSIAGMINVCKGDQQVQDAIQGFATSTIDRIFTTPAIVVKMDETFDEFVARQSGRYAKLCDIASKLMKMVAAVVAIGTTYVVGKKMLQAAKRRVEQPEGGAPITSGSYKEVKARTKKAARKDRQYQYRRAKAIGPMRIPEGSPSTNCGLLQQLVTRNTVRVRGDRTSTNAVFIADHVILIPLHVFKDVERDNLVVTIADKGTYTMLMSDLQEEEVVVCEEQHFVMINLKRLLPMVPIFPSLVRWIQDNEADEVATGVMVTRRHKYARESETEVVVLRCSDVALDDYGFTARTEDRKTEWEIDGVYSYITSSTKGDCGAFLIGEFPASAKIMGFHVAVYNDIRSTAAVLTKEMVTGAMEQVGYVVQSAQLGGAIAGFSDIAFPPEDNGSVTLGTAEGVPLPFRPRKTKLCHSDFFGIAEQQTAPAALHKVEVDGKIVFPSIQAVMKHAGHTTALTRERLQGAFEQLLEAYARPSYWMDHKHALTLEQAIFGMPGSSCTSYASTGGVGYPWCINYHRGQLFCLDPPVITPELRIAVEDLLNQLKEGPVEVVAVDMLKDERRSIVKVEQGDTRLFTVLPIHVNVVTKMLFGAFCFHIQDSHNECPVAIGTSIHPSDWGQIHRYLGLGKRKIIAGDYSGWDRLVGFELMAVACEMANEFYQDEYVEQRKNLVQSILCPVHLNGKWVYQSFRGMSSGSWLTASFNSLANCLLLMTAVEELSVRSMKYAMKVLGDDHVVTVSDAENGVNQRTLAVWLKQFGLKYTTADKKEVLDEFTSLEDLRFLKRAFVQRSCHMFSPMDQDLLLEQIQWYRNTVGASMESSFSLRNQIYETIIDELVHHPEPVYKQIIAAMNEHLDSKDLPKPYYVPSFPVALSKLLSTKYGAEFAEQFKKSQVKCEVCVPGEIQGDEPAEGDQLGTVVAPHETTAEYGLTQFQDLGVPSTLTSTGLETPIVDEAFEVPSAYLNMVERPYRIGTIKLASTVGTQFPIGRWDVVGVLTNVEYVARKLTTAVYVRYNLNIQIRVIATKFHYGLLMAVWRPNYLGGLATYKTTIVEGVSVDYKLPVTSSGGLATGYSAYDHVVTASTTDPIYISITGNTTTAMTIPWCLPYQYVPTTEMNLPRYNFGVLDIYALTDIGPADFDPASVLVYANFTNVRGFGYVNENDVKIMKVLTPVLPLPALQVGTAQKVAPNAWEFGIRTHNIVVGVKAAATTRQNEVVGLGRKPHTIEGDPEPEDHEVPAQETKVLIGYTEPRVSKFYCDVCQVGVTSIAALENHRLGKKHLKRSKFVPTEWSCDICKQNMPNMESYLDHLLGFRHHQMNLHIRNQGGIVEGEEKQHENPESLIMTGVKQIGSTVAGVVGAVTSILAPFSSILGAFGLSRPPSENQIKPMALVPPNIMSSVGLDPSMGFTFNANTLIPVPPEEQTMIETLCRRPAYMGFLTTTTNTLMTEFMSIDPRMSLNVTKFDDGYVGPAVGFPAGFVVDSRYKFFRCATKITVRFFSSAFVCCRFAVSISYTTSISQNRMETFLPTKLVDVQGDTTVELHVPFLRETPWIDIESGRPLVSLGIRQLTSIASPEATETRPIYIAVFAGFPGLQVSGPCLGIASDVAYAKCTFIGTGTGLVPASSGVIEGDEMPLAKFVPKEMEWGMNDIPLSLKHIAKRMLPVASRTGELFVCPWAPGPMVLNNDAGSFRTMYALEEPFCLYPSVAELFRWYRTSITVYNAPTNFNAVGAEWTAGFRYASAGSPAGWDGVAHTAPGRMGEHLPLVRLPFCYNGFYLPTPRTVWRGVKISTPDTSSSYADTSLGPILRPQNFHTKAISDTSSTYFGAADDFDARTFIGVPMFNWVSVNSF